MNNFKVACILSKIVRTPSEESELIYFIKMISADKTIEIDFFNYCKHWKLAPWAFTQLTRSGLLNLLSKETIKLFEDSHLKIQIENESRNKEAVQFLTEFKKQGIDVIILKGNLFAHTVYMDTGYKRMNDFDILIHAEDWDKIQDVYVSLGYIPLGFGWSGEKQKAAKFSHVGMAFISPDFSCIIGSQWGLKSPTTNFKIDIEEAWKSAKDFDFLGVSVKQLSPEYNLLHLILHMGIFKCGIRDCMDVYNLCLLGKIDVDKFFKLIESANAIDKTYFTLTLSNLCSGNLNSLLVKLKPNTSSFIIRRLEKRLATYTITHDFQTSYNDYFQDIEKTVIYFNLFPLFHKKLFFYLYILKLICFPKMGMALKLNDSLHNKSLLSKIKARLKAPYFVFSLIAQEIGWKFTFLLFIKLLIDLLLSLKNYFIKKESYFDYLKKRGVNPQSIEKAVKNIQ